MSMAWELDRRSNFFFNPPVHLCAVTYLTEISLIVTLNNKFTSPLTFLRKTFGTFFRSYSELLSKFGDISFQEYLSKGISHPVFYSDLVYKLRRVKDTPNFFSSGSKIVKRLRRRQYDPVIIGRTIGRSCAWPFYSLV